MKGPTMIDTFIVTAHYEDDSQPRSSTPLSLQAAVETAIFCSKKMPSVRVVEISWQGHIIARYIDGVQS